VDEQRLRRRAEFRLVYDGGVKVAGRYVVVFALPRGRGSRVGLTATRRVGGAVVRNRARRRLRELARRHRGVIDGLRADLVINIRPSCVDAEWVDLESDLLECLQRAGRKTLRLVQPSAC